MKIALILAAVLFACVAAEENECPLMAALQESLKQCVETMKPSEQTMKNLEADKGAEDKDTNCLRACMLNKAGLMKDAKVDLDKFEALMRSGKNAEAKKAEIDGMMAGLRQCQGEAEKSTNECDVAGSYTKCFNALAASAKA